MERHPCFEPRGLTAAPTGRSVVREQRVVAVLALGLALASCVDGSRAPEAWRNVRSWEGPIALRYVDTTGVPRAVEGSVSMEARGFPGARTTTGLLVSSQRADFRCRGAGHSSIVGGSVELVLDSPTCVVQRGLDPVPGCRFQFSRLAFAGELHDANDRTRVVGFFRIDATGATDVAGTHCPYARILDVRAPGEIYQVGNGSIPRVLD
jgi:hypothetical protein